MPAHDHVRQAKRRRPISPWILAPIISVAVALGANMWPRISDARCAAKLRALYFAEDFARAATDPCVRTNVSTKTAAWWVLNRARAGDSAAALSSAQTLISRDPRDPYATLAMAGALLFEHNRASDALRYARIAALAQPDDDAFQWIYIDSLRVRGQFDDASHALQQNPLTAQSPLLATERASVAFDRALQSSKPADAVKIALAETKKAIKLDPGNVRPFLLAGRFFLSANQPDKALPYLAKASSLTWSDSVQSVYFDALRQSSIPTASKIEVANAELQRFRTAKKLTDNTLASAAGFFEQLGMPVQRDRYYDALISEFPNSDLAGQVRFIRLGPKILLASTTLSPNWTTRRQVLHELTKLTNDSAYQGAFFLLGAREQLLTLLLETPSEYRGLIRDTAVKLAKQAEDPALLAKAAIALATVDPHNPHALRIADRAAAIYPSYSRTAALDNPTSMQMFATIGGSQITFARAYARMRSGRTKEARKLLDQALILDPHNGNAMVAIGQMDEAAGRFKEAEEWYIRCSALPPDPKLPCFNSLSKMYLKRNGTEAGLDRYLARLEPRILKSISTRISKTDVEVQRKAVRFELLTADGARISSDSTRGKVVVLVFWGIWCDASRIELPQIFAYAKLFNSSKDVVFMAVNDGRDPNGTREWVAHKDAPALAVSPALVRNFDIKMVPTTVFIDRRGREAYRILGLTRSVDTEFGKRIAFLRAESAL